MDEQFLSPLEVAEILQVKKNTVYEMIKRGDLKATKWENSSGSHGRMSMNIWE